MAERLKRAAAWLGLVTDDRYTDYDDAGSDDASNYDDLVDDDLPNEQRDSADKPATVTPLESRRQTAAASTVSSVGSPVSSVGSTTSAPHLRTADVSRIITVHPRTYNEARIIGE